MLVEDIELSGCQIPQQNGAGIRAEGAGLTLRRCRLYRNEMGLLGSNSPAGEIHVEDCATDHNRADTARPGRLGHNLYIGRFILAASHVSHAGVGHLVKTRARTNLITGNNLFDRAGAPIYLLDLAEGGEAEVTGNRFVQGARSGNRTAIAFAAGGHDQGAGRPLLVAENHFASHGSGCTSVRNHSTLPVALGNNRIEGGARPLSEAGHAD